MTAQTTGLIDAAPYVLDQIRVTVADLRAAWGWLAELVEPGRDSAPMPVLSDDQRARLDQVAAAERADRHAPPVNLPPGARQFAPTSAYASPATRAGARVAVVDARATVRGMVVDVAHMVAGCIDASYVGGAVVLDALDWIDGAIADVRDVDALAAVDAALQRALIIARRAARDSAADPVAPVDHRCPACGRRSLELDYGSEHELVDGAVREQSRRRWTISCISLGCRCVGEGCGCRQRVRYGGRRHAWAYGELAGPYGLWRAIAAADRRRRGPEARVGSETAGHGGWSERRVPRRVGRAQRDNDGVLWWDRERACAQLGVKPQNLWDWARRSARDPDFPRLDPPWRDGPISWYRAEQLLDVDEHLARATKGRNRRAA
jgi:hypothetical protein